MYSVHLCTTTYETVARAIASEAHSPDHPIVVLPFETNHLKGADVEALGRRAIAEAFGD